MPQKLSLPSRERGLKSSPGKLLVLDGKVAPFAGAWIEIVRHANCYHIFIVAPFAGAWIEIFAVFVQALHTLVAPFAGAWIEMPFLTIYLRSDLVAPFAGAWIEIVTNFRLPCAA